MSNGRSVVVGPLAGHGTVAFTFNTASGSGQRALGQPTEAPLFPVSDQTLTVHDMSTKQEAELMQKISVVLRNTLDPDSALNRRVASNKFPFTGIPAGKGVSDPGRLSQVLQSRNGIQASAKQLATIENSPAPTGVILSPGLSAIFEDAPPPIVPAAEAPLPPSVVAAEPPAPEPILAVPEIVGKPEESLSQIVTKKSEPGTTAEPPTAMSTADVVTASSLSTAALLAAEPLFVLPTIEPVGSETPDESSSSSQAQEAADSEASPDPSSEGSASDADEDESDAASHLEDADSADSSSEFIPGKKKASDADDTDEEDDDDDDSDDPASDDDDSISADKDSDVYDEESAAEQEEDDDDDDDEDDDDDDKPLAKPGKRKSSAAAPPKKRTSPTKERSAKPTPPIAQPAPEPKPVPATPASASQQKAAAPTSATGRATKTPASMYPTVSKLLGVPYLKTQNVERAELQTLHAFFNLLSVKNGIGLYENPLREALAPGFSFATANDRQLNALEVHSIEFASSRSELQELRQTMLKQLDTNTSIGDKMRAVLRMICSDEHATLESMPLTVIRPDHRCDLTNEPIRPPLGRDNDSPRSCRVVSGDSGRVINFVTNDLTLHTVNDFHIFFQIEAHLAQKKLARQDAVFVADYAFARFAIVRRVSGAIKEWANDGKFAPSFLQTHGMMSAPLGHDLSWKA